MSFLFTLAAFVFIISVIVFIHEFGHYIVAKWAGVKVETFSIGFGKELFGWNDKSGTRWRVAALPLGGYVKMYGDASEASTPAASIAELPEEEKAKTFYYKPLHKKAAIVAAGPMANFLLTILIFTFILATKGLPSTEPVVGSVMPESAAAEAGLQPGDRILTINEKRVRSFHDIKQFIVTNLGTAITLEVERTSNVIALQLVPKLTKQKDNFGNEVTVPIIGIMSAQVTFQNVGVLHAMMEAVRVTYQTCESMLIAIGQLITGDRSTKEIQGPIGIAKYSGQAAEQGWFTILYFMAMLSANLGLVNLLPIPVLDGGHLVFYAVEAIRRKPLNQKLQEMCFRVGMALIAMLMVYAIFNDLHNVLLTFKE